MTSGTIIGRRRSRWFTQRPIVRRTTCDSAWVSRTPLPDASLSAAMIFGELYKHGEEWKFKAIGQGFAGGLAALATNHGVNLG